MFRVFRSSGTGGHVQQADGLLVSSDAVRPLFYALPHCGVDFPVREQGRRNSFPGEGDEAMHVTKITAPPTEITVPEHRCTPEQLQNEFNYTRAEMITKKMLEKGLITAGEFDKIMAENRQIFSPYLAAIL